MAIAVIQLGSREYFSITTTSTSGTEPTSIDVAIIPAGTVLDPDTATWYPAELITGGAQILVGPGGGIALARGQYAVHARIEADPEEPIRYSGPLTIR